MKKVVIILTFLFVILLVGIIYLLITKGLFRLDTAPNNKLIETGIGPTLKPIDEETKDKTIKADGVTLGNIKSATVDASNFKFVPDTLTVNLGDTVTITFTNSQGLHNFSIDEFNVKSKILEANKSEEITFMANKKGTFQFYCSVGQHRAMGMVGSITVE